MGHIRAHSLIKACHKEEEALLAVRFDYRKEQSMPQGKDWYAFLNNGKNKIELIHFLANHHKSESVRSMLEIPLVFTEPANTWLITSANVCLLEQCNHHKADTSVL